MYMKCMCVLFLYVCISLSPQFETEGKKENVFFLYVLEGVESNCFQVNTASTALAYTVNDRHEIHY